MMLCEEREGYSCIALRYIEGKTVNKVLYLGGGEEDKKIISDITGILATFHSIQRNNEMCNIVKRDHINDINTFTQMLRDLDGNADLMDATHESVHGFLSKQNEKDVLVHGDLGLGNLLLDRNGKVYLFDFATAFWGDPDYDIGVLTKQGHMKITDFIKSGRYGRNVNLEAVMAYQMLFCVMVMAYCCPYNKEYYGVDDYATYSGHKKRLIECLRT
jgi:aminoglycoside phosphotransferase (APT) family kinase protein